MARSSRQRRRPRFEDHLPGAVPDRLGRDSFLTGDGPARFTVRTDAAVSPRFFAWCCGFGAQILPPAGVVDQMGEHARSAAARDPPAEIRTPGTEHERKGGLT